MGKEEREGTGGRGKGGVPPPLQSCFDHWLLVSDARKRCSPLSVYEYDYKAFVPPPHNTGR